MQLCKSPIFSLFVEMNILPFVIVSNASKTTNPIIGIYVFYEWVFIVNVIGVIVRLFVEQSNLVILIRFSSKKLSAYPVKSHKNCKNCDVKCRNIQKRTYELSNYVFRQNWYPQMRYRIMNIFFSMCNWNWQPVYLDVTKNSQFVLTS